jgi:hypothetical protein
MGTFLALMVHARPVVLNGGAGLPQATIRLNGQNGNAAATVVGDDGAFSVCSDCQMAWAGSPGGFLIEQGHGSGFSIQPEGADCACVLPIEIANLVYRVKELKIGVDRQKGGVFRLGNQLGCRQVATPGAELGNINATTALAGVCAKIHKLRLFSCVF